MARKSRKNVLSGEFPLLKSIGLYATTIQGDGNCLFRSLADQLYGKDDLALAMVIRQSVVDYMKSHSAYFELFYSSEWDESWDQYVDRMSRSSVYGGNLELVAFASAYQLDVVVYQTDVRFIITAIDESKGERRVELEPDQGGVRPEKVHIAYHTWEHYSSVRCLNGPYTGPPGITSNYLKSFIPKDSDMVPNSEVADDSEWKIKQLRDSLPFEVPSHILAKVLKDHTDVGEAVDYFLENGIPEDIDEPESSAKAEETATSPSCVSDHTSSKKESRAQKAAARVAKRQAKAREDATSLNESAPKLKLKEGKKDTARAKKEKQKARNREKKLEAKSSSASMDQTSSSEIDYKVVMV